MSHGEMDPAPSMTFNPVRTFGTTMLLADDSQRLWWVVPQLNPIWHGVMPDPDPDPHRLTTVGVQPVVPPPTAARPLTGDVVLDATDPQPAPPPTSPISLDPGSMPAALTLTVDTTFADGRHLVLTDGGTWYLATAMS